MTHALAFSRDFKTDFDVAVQGLRKDYDGPPYAFVRFADGEASILRGYSYRAVSDGWEVTRHMPTLRRDMEAAIGCNLPGWCVGITAESHHPADHAFLLRHVSADMANVSFAELLIFSNWQRFLGLDINHCRIIGAGAEKLGKRGCPLPPDAVQDDDFDYEPVIDWMCKSRGPILLSAGPLAKTIAYWYWRGTYYTGARQDVVIDVGSALSPLLRGRNTRRYHSRRSPTRSLVPTWKIPE